MRASGADQGAETTAHSPLGDAVEQVCKQDSLNACDALIGFAVNAGLAREERTRIARQRLDDAAAAIQLKPETEASRTLDANSALGRDLLPTAFLGSSLRLVGILRLLGVVRGAPETVRFHLQPVDTAKARRWIAQAVRLDQSLSKTSVLLEPDVAERLDALREKELQELEREKQEEANKKDYLPEKAISAVVELPSVMKTLSQSSLADAVNEKAITFLESMESDESRPELERIRLALHLGILKRKKGDAAGAKAEFQKALKMNCKVGLPHDMPEDAPVDLAKLLETTRKEAFCPDLQTVVIGAGSGAAICVGGVFSYLMLRSHQAEHDAYVRGDYRAYLARQSDAVLRAAIADGLYAVGAAGVIYLLFFNRPPPPADATSISLVPGPSGLVVGGSF